MSTEMNPQTIATTPPPTEPAHPAKGNQRGQRTLVAKIDRWSALGDNLTPYIDQLPQLKDAFIQFQAMLGAAKTLRNTLKKLRADTGEALTQRNDMLDGGEDLYTRLSLGLQSVHGPTSDRLHEFGLKPKKKSGRRPATPIVPQAPEAPVTGAAGTAPKPAVK